MTAIKRHYVEVAPGIELYVEEAGAGRPIVFVPGWTGRTEDFARQVPHFARHYRVVTFDPRCQGRSTKTFNGLSYRQQGRDLAKLANILGLQDPVFVPWSNGCIAVWEFVRQFGAASIAGVVFVDQPPRAVAMTAEDWSVSSAEESFASLRSFIDDPRGTLRSFFSSIFELAPAAEDLEQFIDASMTTPPFAAALYLADGMARDETDMAESLDGKVPVLHVVNSVSGPKARSWLARHAPSARLEAFGTHMMPWEHAERFNSVVSAFLAEHRL